MLEHLQAIIVVDSFDPNGDQQLESAKAHLKRDFGIERDQICVIQLPIPFSMLGMGKQTLSTITWLIKLNKQPISVFTVLHPDIDLGVFTFWEHNLKLINIEVIKVGTIKSADVAIPGNEHDYLAGQAAEEARS